MNKNYVTPRKTLLHSGLLALGMLTLISFKDIDPKKTQSQETAPAQTDQLFEVKVNFQDKETIPPAGYLKDYGKEFGSASASFMGKDYNYGWKRLSDDTPFDVSVDATDNKTGVGRNRLGSAYASASEQEQLEGTLVHFQGNDVISFGDRQWISQPRGTEVFWELEVLDGDNNYTVEIGLGDKDATNLDSRHTATVEDYTIISAFVPTAGQTKTATMIVKVTDGLLTIKGTGGFNSKIDYIKVTENVADEPTTKDEVLAFTPAAAELNVGLGDMGEPITTTLTGQGATDIGLAIDNNFTLEGRIDETGVNDWISLDTQNSNGLGDYSFPVTPSSIGIVSEKPTRQNTIIATAKGFKPASFEASLLVGCSPLSTLACDQLVKGTPVELNFDGNDGGLVDATGDATGFTLAAPHDGTRLDQDPEATYIAVNGYEPTKLNVNQGQLSITATKGLALGTKDDKGEAANKQVNTLGVGLAQLTAAVQLETKLMAVNTGTSGFQQTGIHFSVNQDNYVKLVVIGDNIEMRKEVDGVTAAGEKNDDNIIVKNLGLTGKYVSLALVIDPVAKTATGFYAVNDGDFQAMEKDGKTSLTLPDALLNGRNVNDDITGVSLAGVFASYNQADTDFVADFDYFRVVPKNLSINAGSLEASNGIVAYPNPATAELNVRLGQNAAAVKSITVFDIQGRTVSSFDPNTVKSNNGFKLPTATLKAGVYFVQLQNENGENQQVRFIANN